MTGNLHPIPKSARNAWLALVIVRIYPLRGTACRDSRDGPQVFWILWGLGMALLPRQWKQETASIAVSKTGPSDEEHQML
jgi:hypothetical protein